MTLQSRAADGSYDETERLNSKGNDGTQIGRQVSMLTFRFKYDVWKIAEPTIRQEQYVRE